MNDQTKKVATLVGALLVVFTLIMLYQALVVIPNERIAAEERAVIEKARLERLEKIEKAEKYDACMATAYRNYSDNWDQHCEMIGLEADCSLPAYNANLFEERKETAQDRCVTMYR